MVRAKRKTTITRDRGVMSVIPEGWYSTGEAAQRAGVGYTTLKKWRSDGFFTGSSEMKAGKLTVSLYNDDDVAKIKELRKTRKAGRKPKAAVEDENAGRTAAP